LVAIVVGLSPAARTPAGTQNRLGRIALSATSSDVSDTVSVATLRAMQREYQDELKKVRSACSAAEAQVATLQKELAQAKNQHTTSEIAMPAANEWDEKEIEEAFDAVDEDGNGTLDLDEFRKGYALLNGDAVARVFDAIDDNGDGVLSKEEFRKGFVLLTSDSQLAKAERAKAEAAVEAAKVEAVKQAARNLAEAQLMDTLSGIAAGKFPAEYQPVPGQQPLRRPPARPVGMLSKSQRDRSRPSNDLKRMRKNPRLR